VKKRVIDGWMPEVTLGSVFQWPWSHAPESALFRVSDEGTEDFFIFCFEPDDK